jgi:hypothetical protein
MGIKELVMEKDWAGQYYEEEGFEYPLWTQIKAYAEEKDISYLKASEALAPEFAKGVRIRDIAFEDEQVNKRVEHFKTLKALPEED